MDKQQTKTTDQQATNATLAALAAAGNSFALGQLWEVNKGFVRRQRTGTHRGVSGKAGCRALGLFRVA